MDKQLILYSGQDCHLCDLALAQLEQVSAHHLQSVEKVDVKGDPALYHLYGARIPVFKRTDNNAELGWPFEPEQLQAFLQ